MIHNKDYSDLTNAIALSLKKSDTFLAEWAATLAKIPLVKIEDKVDIVSTFQSLSSIGSVEPGTIKSFIKGCHMTPFSSYGPPKSATFNAAVPILLYAHKQYNNVPYKAWTGQKYTRTLLPHALKDLPFDMDFESSVELFKDEFKLEEARILTVTDGKGVQHNFSDYKCNPIGCKAWDDLPKVARMMRLQVWKFHPSKRNEWMILNWSNWDHMPKPIDTVQVEDDWSWMEK